MPLATAPKGHLLGNQKASRGAGIPLALPGRLSQNAGQRSEDAGRRRPLLVIAGALVVLVCGALGALAAGRTPRPVAYLAVAHTVPLGMPLAVSDLETVSIVPAPGLDAIPLGDARQVVGRRVTASIEAGSLLVSADLASGTGLAAGVALVGASLAAGELPGDLASGQQVLVVLSGAAPAGGLASTTSAAVGAPVGPAGSILGKATVVSVSGPGSSAAEAASTQPTGYLVTLEVPEAAAAPVAAASAAGEVSLAVLGGSS